MQNINNYKYYDMAETIL